MPTHGSLTKAGIRKEEMPRRPEKLGIQPQRFNQLIEKDQFQGFI